MSQSLVSLNPDLAKLREAGFAISFDSKCLVVRDIPYLDAQGQLLWGALVAKLVYEDELGRVTQDDHQVFFSGSHPCGLDGIPIPNLGGGTPLPRLSERCPDLVLQRSFSCKPKTAGRYENFYHKISAYTDMIAGPAVERYGVTPLTHASDETVVEDPIFKLQDTLSSRAGIEDLSAKLHEEIVAVVGLGGTGAYVLDFIVKSPVAEVRGFDVDPYHVHNSFRSPGRLDPRSEFGRTKAEVYQARYENFRHGLSLVPLHLDDSCAELLDGVTFAFVCVDHGPARAKVFDLLGARKIPFIDVGIGLNRKHGPLGGAVRTTYYSAEDAELVKSLGLSELSARAEDLYDSNIQIGELNALNAAIAVMKFKQLKGFYREERPVFHQAFNIGTLEPINEASPNDLHSTKG
jgi:hypothetical protein